VASLIKLETLAKQHEKASNNTILTCSYICAKVYIYALSRNIC